MVGIAPLEPGRLVPSNGAERDKPMTPPTPDPQPAEAGPAEERPRRTRLAGVSFAVVAAMIASVFALSGVASAQIDDDAPVDDDTAVENVEDDDNDNDDDGDNNRRRNRRRGNRGNNNGGNNNGGGGFNFDCEVSHFNSDDPIVFPGEVDAAHAHMFWGNTSTDAFSTIDSLLANEDSTCEGRRDGNVAAYWTPVLFDENGDAVEPTDIDVRYRGRRNVNAIPVGLEMLTTPDVLGAEDNDFEIDGDSEEVEFEINYPNCLAVDADGEPVLSSDDNISHTAFSDGGDCPDSHPYRIPRLQIDLEFDLDIDTDWRLSSDHEGMEQGASLHADYMAAWTDDPPGS